MEYEQAFEEIVDTEHVFVLQCQRSEQVFERGDAMSVAFEVEYESAYPKLQLVPDYPAPRIGLVSPTPPARLGHRRLALVLVVAVLLVLLVLPIRAFGGKALAASVPTAGQTYIVKGGDTLASIARQVDPSDAGAMAQRLAHEVGSSVVVPGEHLLIP
jgi:hypothetical protein